MGVAAPGSAILTSGIAASAARINCSKASHASRERGAILIARMACDGGLRRGGRFQHLLQPLSIFIHGFAHGILFPSPRPLVRCQVLIFGLSSFSK